MFRLSDYEDGLAIAISWHVDDVISLDSSLSVEQAKTILKSFENNHDGSMNQLWQDLQYHVNEYKRQHNDNS